MSCTRRLYNIGECNMPIETSYSELRAHLAEYMDRVVDDSDTLVIHRRNGKDVALIPATELASWKETAYLLSSPRNAERLLKAIRQSRTRKTKPRSIESLRKEMGIDRQ